MYEQIQKSLVLSAKAETIEYPVLRFDTKVKRLVKVLLRMDKPAVEKDPIHWPNALDAQGLLDTLDVFRHIEDEGICAASDTEAESVDLPLDDIEETLNTFLSSFEKSGYHIRGIENTVAGSVFLGMMKYEKFKVRAKIAAQAIFDYLVKAPTDERGAYIYNPNRPNKRVFVDMIGMAVPFLSMYGKLMNEPKAFEMAETQLACYIGYGMDEESGFPYHVYEFEPFSQIGEPGWGRAVGWLMMGEAAYLKYAPKDCKFYEECVRFFRAITDVTIKHMYDDGMLGWHLNEAAAREDTSATAMCVNAMLSGILDSKTIDKKYLETINKSTAAILTYFKDGKIYGASAECIDVGVYQNVFGAYPWSLGPTLSVLSKVMK